LSEAALINIIGVPSSRKLLISSISELLKFSMSLISLAYKTPDNFTI